MRLRGKAAVLAVFGVLALMPAAGFGQAGPTTPPAGEALPDAGTVGPDVPEGRPTPPVLSVPPGVPPGMGLGGRDCESERAPGVGV
jgi:hypothetical protein